MDPIVLSNKHYRVFESLFNVEGEVHMNITFAEYIKVAMEAAGFLFQWLKKGRFDPPAGLAGGPLFVFKASTELKY
ncbi:hypothetical protein OH76DRAFT_1490837 [Lentinus brumalis]|uniref:Uncharacterized protein n=1 Tax=Lentinus brumalis TaxID=2498619 RepID=A0A371CHP2_9APHY|nr:hypothetical protein OH76DRAFT_1490837 [Polyporus brumalis]